LKIQIEKKNDCHFTNKKHTRFKGSAFQEKFGRSETITRVYFFKSRENKNYDNCEKTKVEECQ